MDYAGMHIKKTYEMAQAQGRGNLHQVNAAKEKLAEYKRGLEDAAAKRARGELPATYPTDPNAGAVAR